MLKFYYDFLERYFDRRDFELQMYTDSNYMVIFAEQLEDIVKPQKKQWLAWDKWSGRILGLFKLECIGWRMIALCLKCYFIEQQEGEKRISARRGCRRSKME